MYVMSIVANVWTMYFRSLSVRTFFARLISVTLRKLGTGNGLGSSYDVHIHIINGNDVNIKTYYLDLKPFRRPLFRS